MRIIDIGYLAFGAPLNRIPTMNTTELKAQEVLFTFAKLIRNQSFEPYFGAATNRAYNYLRENLNTPGLLEAVNDDHVWSYTMLFESKRRELRKMLQRG